MTRCNVKGVAQEDKPTDYFPPDSAVNPQLYTVF